ncbi:Late embryogenesis abundant protein Lea14-A isoform A [Glycine soja]|uniref:Late embryogenesis abundant protein Lea14-A isoform A n=2 Tax=Glycine soja TaxID=3848 RepID=A0A445H144_GLYSO|nr:Late embryogenesis abundant protein Lea14-A isoform A [Glycine soja]
MILFLTILYFFFIIYLIIFSLQNLDLSAVVEWCCVNLIHTFTVILSLSLSLGSLISSQFSDMSTSDKPEVVERGSKDEKHKEDDQEEGKGGFIEKVKDFIHDIGEKIEEAIGFGKPTADVTAIHIPSINLHKADLVVDVLIKNPNPVPIPLIDIDYLVDSDERKLVSGLIPDAGTIGAHGEQTVKIPVTLIYDDIKQTYADIKPGSIIPYRVKVSLIFDVPILGRLTLPLEKTGEIPIPYKPDIDLEKIHFERFSFEETIATLHLKLENKNDFDLGLNALDYEVWLGDVSIGGAELTKSAKIEKSGISYIDIPITFRPKDFGSALWDMIRGRGTGYTMKGHIDVDTPFGAMKLPISKEGGTTRLKKKKEDRDYDDDDDDEVC